MLVFFPHEASSINAEITRSKAADGFALFIIFLIQIKPHLFSRLTHFRTVPANQRHDKDPHAESNGACVIQPYPRFSFFILLTKKPGLTFELVCSGFF